MKFLTENEASKLLGVSAMSIRSMTKDGILFSVDELYPDYLFNGDSVNVGLSFISQIFRKKNIDSEYIHSWLTGFDVNIGVSPLEYLRFNGFDAKIKMVASVVSDIEYIAS